MSTSNATLGNTISSLKMVVNKDEKQNAKKLNKSSIEVKRHFTKAGEDQYGLVEWKKVEIPVKLASGTMLQREIEVPEYWSETAAKIAGSKYFRGRMESNDWEHSAKQMIGRVVKTLREWSTQFGYFDTLEEADIFADELTHILLHQKAAFNSPVWFNMGMVKPKPQCSACFILSVEDSMESILEWISTEGRIFKNGSGAGINLSPLRGSRERLKQGGFSSGPVAFMRGADAVAGMIKSGGATRRAAKMVVLNVEHPDSLEFIRTKANEEKKIKALIEGGFNMYDLNDKAWESIQFQNANNSIRVTNDFMRAVERGGQFYTRYINSGEIAEALDAREVMREIAKATWESGDPGMQFDTTINDWHTCPNTGRINASNPCSEYMHVDNSACNLASINLIKYLNTDGSFATPDFIHTVGVLFLAQEIIVGGSSYPTKKIEENTIAMRQIGLGYANLGALLMSMGLPYDSAMARHTAAAITSLMTGVAYKESALIAKRMKPFSEYEKNKARMLRVISKHREKVLDIDEKLVNDKTLYLASGKAWDDAFELGEKYGYRNAQATVLAPTGTIAFMMDCTTTGVEPDFSLVKMKTLVGGGILKMVNSVVPRALEVLGYSTEQISNIASHIEQNGTVEGSPDLKEEHLAVFDCAVAPTNGSRSIHWQGHVNMVAAVQPFISGAISKTFNVPHEISIEEIENIYIEAWRLGVKAIAIYRDGSKMAQPMLTSSGHAGKQNGVARAKRRRLPDVRQSETHKFEIVGHSGFLTYSTYDDGTLAEIFITMHKQGSMLSGLLDSFAICVSVSLQYGVPLKELVRKFSFTRYEPAGFTKNPDLAIATSITDYIFRYLAQRFFDPEVLSELGINVPASKQSTVERSSREVKPIIVKELRAPSDDKKIVYAGGVCKSCGGMLVQTGTCKTCISCGTSNGGC